jgi:hypothetical protein
LCISSRISSSMFEDWIFKPRLPLLVEQMFYYYHFSLIAEILLM